MASYLPFSTFESVASEFFGKIGAQVEDMKS